MAKKKDTVAMLLAGGQGSRLYALTHQLAKPAVTYGGKYRIIDFVLSNCINSGIDTVGVLTQYQPLILNEYIGNGQPWDLDRTFGGVHVLPPYQAKDKSEWYKGTANAIYQNLHFIDSYDPDHVIVLGGDHIYKMDYQEMMKIHIEKDSDCTIAVLPVDLKEASRFGIMNCDETGKILEFEEKPVAPKSNLASMGIYVFKAEVLKKYLVDDENTLGSENDFGKNIIPNMLADAMNMQTYRFEGYWKDVGTLYSLWEANMELLGDPKFDVYEPEWRIHSRNPIVPPQYVAEGAVMKNSIIAGGCEVEGTVINSILSAGVKVKKGAVVRDSVIFADVEVGAGAEVSYSIIDERVTIGAKARVGGEKNTDDEIAVIGRDSILADGGKVSAGEILDCGGKY
ncbi:MAG: glucose-1-phosphate adenylyltransferase [Bacillota bacterium]